MSLPLDHSLAKGDDFLAEFLAGPCPMSYDYAAGLCLSDEIVDSNQGNPLACSDESEDILDLLLRSTEPAIPVYGSSYSGDFDTGDPVTTRCYTSDRGESMGTQTSSCEFSRNTVLAGNTGDDLNLGNDLIGQLDSVTGDTLSYAVALSDIIPVEDQTDQVKKNPTDRFLESPTGDENPSCENDSGDVLTTKEIFGQVSSSEHESTGVSVEPESVNHPSTTECGVMAVPDEPMSKKVTVVRSKKAQKSFNKRAKENEKFARLRFIFKIFNF